MGAGHWTEGAWSNFHRLHINSPLMLKRVNYTQFPDNLLFIKTHTFKKRPDSKEKRATLREMKMKRGIKERKKGRI